ncbi:MAG: acyl-CoA synthetase [Gemmatimonadota bacterium]|nr:acyl-CoA synthetase [Gemmatimonadota bacterium]
MAEVYAAGAGAELLRRAAERDAALAVVDEGGERSWGEVRAAAEGVAAWLADTLEDPRGAFIATLAPPGAGWVSALLGIWRAGGIAVPLAPSHPEAELAYVLDDAGADAVLVEEPMEERISPLARERSLALGRISEAARRAEDPASPPPDGDAAALVLYTSGTTGRPKGVVHTHVGLAAQIVSLEEAWGWSPEDRILHCLPLHHTHGIVNALLCPLWVGATVEMLPGFDADAVWRRFVGSPITLFMAVPTIYHRLIAAWEEAEEEGRAAMSEACREQRLMVSGSAALPVPVFERWREISGHDLLERYGMTEVGMALSNPLEGERRPGTVGHPLPGVAVRLVTDEGEEIGAEGMPGEIHVSGPTLFREYLGRPEETAEAFDGEWFRTGDQGVVEDGYWRILGRRSVDILKSGGEKVSALEVEDVLRTHPAVDECAVVGVADPEWGERVCAAVVPADGAGIALDEIEAWTKERLAPHKVPRRWAAVDRLPRNAMGKVSKPTIAEMFE